MAYSARSLSSCCCSKGGSSARSVGSSNQRVSSCIIRCLERSTIKRHPARTCWTERGLETAAAKSAMTKMAQSRGSVASSCQTSEEGTTATPKRIASATHWKKSTYAPMRIMRLRHSTTSRRSKESFCGQAATHRANRVH